MGQRQPRRVGRKEAGGPAKGSEPTLAGQGDCIYSHPPGTSGPHHVCRYSLCRRMCINVRSREVMLHWGRPKIQKKCFYKKEEGTLMQRGKSGGDRGRGWRDQATGQGTPGAPGALSGEPGPAHIFILDFQLPDCERIHSCCSGPRCVVTWHGSPQTPNTQGGTLVSFGVRWGSTRTWKGSMA